MRPIATDVTRSMVCFLFVCVSLWVLDTWMSCVKIGWTDRDVISGADLRVSKQPRISWQSWSPYGKGQFWGGGMWRPIIRCNVPVHECTTHYSPAAVGECACSMHAVAKYICRHVDKTAMQPFAKFLLHTFCVISRAHSFPRQMLSNSAAPFAKFRGSPRQILGILRLTAAAQFRVHLCRLWPSYAPKL